MFEAELQAIYLDMMQKADSQLRSRPGFDPATTSINYEKLSADVLAVMRRALSDAAETAMNESEPAGRGGLADLIR